MILVCVVLCFDVVCVSGVCEYENGSYELNYVQLCNIRQLVVRDSVVVGWDIEINCMFGEFVVLCWCD